MKNQAPAHSALAYCRNRANTHCGNWLVDATLVFPVWARAVFRTAFGLAIQTSRSVKLQAMFYLDLFASLHRHQVEYVLIGGLAVALHGVERNTMDIDVCVVISPDN